MRIRTRCNADLHSAHAVMRIRTRCNEDPDPGSASTTIQIRINMRIRIQGVNIGVKKNVYTVYMEILDFFTILIWIQS